MTLFFTEAQAADLLGVDEEQVRAWIAEGELTRTPDGIPAAEVAAWILERERGS